MKLTKINQVIAFSSIAFITTAFAHEVITSQSPIIVNNTIKNQPANNRKEAPKVDPATAKIEKEILTPLRFQEMRSHRFSRSMPTRSNSYHLVETGSDKEEGARYFDIQIVTNDSFKLIIMNNDKTTQKKDLSKAEINTVPKIEPKTFLKIKYLSASDKILIQQNDEWVERSKHKYLSLLPVTTIKK